MFASACSCNCDPCSVSCMMCRGILHLIIQDSTDICGAKKNCASVKVLLRQPEPLCVLPVCLFQLGWSGTQILCALAPKLQRLTVGLSRCSPAEGLAAATFPGCGVLPVFPGWSCPDGLRATALSVSCLISSKVCCCSGNWSKYFLCYSMERTPSLTVTQDMHFPETQHACVFFLLAGGNMATTVLIICIKMW